MRTAVVYNTRQPLVLEERPIPAPGDDDVLIKVASCGICGSELHAFNGPERTFDQGLVMGHEYSGTIVECGKNVSTVSVGDRVAVYPAKGCGHCTPCSRGNAILCPDARRLMGGFAEYACVPASTTVILPETLSLADGALIEPLAVAYYGVKQAAINTQTCVLILGAGSIALATAFWAKRMGAKSVLVASRSEQRATLATAMGADSFATYAQLKAAGVSHFLGGSAQVVFECIGYPGFLQMAVDHADTYGSIISLGFGNDADTLIPASAGIKDITLRFPVGYSLDDFNTVARTMNDDIIKPDQLISSYVSLRELPEKIECMRAANSDTKVQINYAL